jgi:hypothetical protein
LRPSSLARDVIRESRDDAKESPAVAEERAQAGSIRRALLSDCRHDGKE